MPAPTLHVALVSELPEILPAELARVAAALSVQVTRDLAPAWDVNATVDVFHDLGHVPNSHWPVVIEKDIDTPGAAGVHENKDDGSPFALVAYSSDWPLTASHEVLEMLVDPSGSRLVPALVQGQPVKVLVEVADPSEDDQFAYQVNGVTVSDFALPSFYASPGIGPFSFTGAVAAPLQICPGGYMSYVDASGNWHQITWFDGDAPLMRTLGRLKTGDGSFRSQIDRLTRSHRATLPKPEKPFGFGPALTQLQHVLTGAERTKSLRGQIQALKSAV